MKKFKIIFSFASVSSLALLSPIVTQSCSKSNSNSDYVPDKLKPEDLKPVESIEDIFGEVSEDKKQQQIPVIDSFVDNKMEIVNNNIQRNVNNKEYETELITKYGSQGFKYPAWNYNYESGDNKFLTLNDGSKIDMMQLVYEERTPDGRKYSDPSFIREEIENGNLKKHPIANQLFEFGLQDYQKAVDKFFSLQSTLLGPTSLGLYAPAGEIVTIKFSKQTYDQMVKQNINNFEIIINNAYWDNYEPGNSGQISKRYPFMQSRFTIRISDIDTSDYSYKFATPFGGTITAWVSSKLKSSTYNDIYPSYNNYEFNIIGACETLTYNHGITTYDEWKDQLRRIKNEEITSPEFSLDFSYGSSWLPFTEKNKIAGINVDDVIYPQDVMRKWNDFLFVSEYFASRDRNVDVRKIDFRFNDDIWGGAGAWGGGNRLSAPVSWGANAFLNDIEWTIGNNWGTFHEINHNFQQDAAFFIKNTHGETNQVTIAAMSLLGDVGRWRNPYNITGEYSTDGWRRMANMYTTIEFIKNNNYNQSQANEWEYQIYNLLLYAMGSYNYIEYARHDIANSNGTYVYNGNTIQKEGGFYEIIELSDYMKLDFWPALSNYYPIWHDENSLWGPDHQWPSSYDQATSYQKNEIQRLRENYKSFDFIGNMYATGSYLWDNNKKDYVYQNDMKPAYQIPVGKSYTFDFEKGINWLANNPNYQFSWSKLEFSSKTKLGGSLKLDPKNSKKLIYTPPKGENNLAQDDEFDIAIIPDKFKGRPSNYVSKYKWKIKVKQVVDAPVVSIYNAFTSDNFKPEENNINGYLKYMSNDKNIIYESINKLNSPVISSTNGKVQTGARLRFNFIAPETGSYKFRFKHPKDCVVVDRRKLDDSYKVTSIADPNIIYYSYVKNMDKWSEMGISLNLSKGDIIPLEIFIQNFGGSGGLSFYMDTLFNNQEDKVDLSKNIVCPNASELVSNPADLLTDKYRYKSRVIDYNYFQTSMFGQNVSREFKMVDLNAYNFRPLSSNVPEWKANNLKEFDQNYCEVWSKDPVEVQVEFNQETSINGITFYHRTNNWTDRRPTWMTITNGETNEIIYDGEYAAQFNDYSAEKSLFNFDKQITIKKLNFKFINETFGDCVVLDAIKFNKERIVQTNKVIASNDSKIRPYGNWTYIKNGSENVSTINGTSLKSLNSGDFISFDLFAQGFDIVGQKAPSNSIFDVYINDKLVQTVDTSSPSKQMGQILFSYTIENGSIAGEMMRIKIVNKSNKPLYIDYFQTYGTDVFVY